MNAQFFRRHHDRPDPACVPTEPAPEASTASSMPWACWLRGHHYVIKRLPNNFEDGGLYRVCERCNHEKRPSGRPPSTIGW